MFYSAKYFSPVGPLTMASDGINLVGLWIDGQKHFLNSLSEIPTHKEDLAVFSQTRNWLDRYFSGNKPDPAGLPLKPFGNPFRQSVWNCLYEISYGQVLSYGAIAKKIAAEMGRESMSAQAIGSAVSHNPISIIIPCHRVIGANGSLTGYAGGIDKKIILLKHEGIDVENLSLYTLHMKNI